MVLTTKATKLVWSVNSIPLEKVNEILSIWQHWTLYWFQFLPDLGTAHFFCPHSVQTRIEINKHKDDNLQRYGHI